MGKVLTKAGKEIDRKSAGNVRRSKEEAKADDEPENEFGYTDSMFCCTFLNFNTLSDIAYLDMVHESICNFNFNSNREN